MKTKSSLAIKKYLICYLLIVLPLFFFLACKEKAEIAVPKLIEQLKSKDTRTRSLAAQKLSYYGKDAKDAVVPLIETLWDNNMGVRTASAYALDMIGTLEAKKALAEYKQEKERQ